ncbi:MAG: hypothetical protein FJ086_08895 [Deltaproteobacteria bacterium]|nr:hypothetical protein [Deltaproteobacteria bacterium]
MSLFNALAATLSGLLLLSAVAVASPSPEPLPAPEDGAPSLSGKPARDGGSRDDEDLAPTESR